MTTALAGARASVVASAVLAGGALTGKYGVGGNGRLAGERDAPRWQQAFRIGERRRELAEGLATSPSRLAIAFCLANPRVASVVFGATSPDQIVDDVGALGLLARLGETEVAELRAISVTPAPD